MANYIDMFVVPVPKKNIETYRKDADLFFQVWRDHGALSCVEVEGDDVPVGKPTSDTPKPATRIWVMPFFLKPKPIVLDNARRCILHHERAASTSVPRTKRFLRKSKCNFNYIGVRAFILSGAQYTLGFHELFK